ncbi:hypothetical protein HDA32_005848 [Spinactinospora alkalitolerans]|uniref:Uncharacterized protein n=1 Tax=Spinactinospora alkalitolerans TaxID=687207 RepID=A0A852U3C8_9ACTN|nr:hypothetical protein [Spinactinospora alkalitolerans]
MERALSRSPCCAVLGTLASPAGRFTIPRCGLAKPGTARSAPEGTSAADRCGRSATSVSISGHRQVVHRSGRRAWGPQRCAARGGHDLHGVLFCACRSRRTGRHPPGRSRLGCRPAPHIPSLRAEPGAGRPARGRRTAARPARPHPRPHHRPGPRPAPGPDRRGRSTGRHVDTACRLRAPTAPGARLHATAGLPGVRVRPVARTPRRRRRARCAPVRLLALLRGTRHSDEQEESPTEGGPAPSAADVSVQGKDTGPLKGGTTVPVRALTDTTAPSARTNDGQTSKSPALTRENQALSWGNVWTYQDLNLGPHSCQDERPTRSPGEEVRESACFPWSSRHKLSACYRPAGVRVGCCHGQITDRPRLPAQAPFHRPTIPFPLPDRITLRYLSAETPVPSRVTAFRPSPPVGARPGSRRRREAPPISVGASGTATHRSEGA